MSSTLNADDWTSQPQKPPATPAQVVWGWALGYIKTTRLLLTEPSRFFRALPEKSGSAAALLYALLTHWLGTAVQFLWITWIGGQFTPWFKSTWGRLTSLAQDLGGNLEEIDSLGRHAHQALVPFQERLGSWVFSAGPVLLDPITEIFSILFVSALVWVGARLLVSPGKNGAPMEVRFEAALQIVCYASGASILNVLPAVGPGLAALFGAVLAIIGAREVWKVSTARAIVIGLFPKLLLLGAFLSLLGVLILFLAKLILSIFTL